MTMQTPVLCSAEHGPWESEPCPASRREQGGWFTNADAAVYVLETGPGPLTVYDIQRGIRREFGWAPSKASLNVSLANDRRCCWGGRGIYGLYRHGLIPGPRRLADVGRFLLFVADGPLEAPALEFAMKRMGYRFHRMSLAHALARADHIKWPGWDLCTVDRSPIGAKRIRESIPVAPTQASFDFVVDRTRRALADALQERQHRLRHVHHGLSASDLRLIARAPEPGNRWSLPPLAARSRVRRS
jgi:hypothetical protein